MSATEDVPMFEVTVPEVTTPTRPKAAGRPRWSKYRPVNPVKCDDCMLVLTLAKGAAPLARFARHKRAVDGDYLLLCEAHANARKAEDGIKDAR